MWPPEFLIVWMEGAVNIEYGNIENGNIEFCHESGELKV